MKIESLSIKSSTIIIIGMIGVIAIILSLFAGSYFKHSAMSAQINSLSRVIEVASQEMLHQVRKRSLDVAMTLSQSNELIAAIKSFDNPLDKKPLVDQLNDPFINGFVGFSKLDLKKLKVYNLNFEVMAESSVGSENLNGELSASLSNIARDRKATDRLKAIDVLWIAAEGPLLSTLVPLGGLRPIGYLEVIVNPVFNLPDIGNITKTPVQIYSISGEMINSNNLDVTDGHLPVAFTIHATDGAPAFEVVGYENIDVLSKEMNQTKLLVVTCFLLLSLSSLVFALWLFNRFLFVPASRMITDMQQVTDGKLDLTVNSEGLKEFHLLADAFNTMTKQVKLRTNDLQRLLNLDSSALMCFDHDNDAVYFNIGATQLFGYSNNEIIDLDCADFFVEDLQLLLNNTEIDRSQKNSMLNCIHKDGTVFVSNASINKVDVMGDSGFAIILNALSTDEDNTLEKNDQRLDTVEQALSGLLAFAKQNPESIQEIGNLSLQADSSDETNVYKSRLREQVVKVMNIALSCWEQDVGKTKIELAEESSIWPVYIDKSTPTTRTLDKYLNIDLCPKNPRSQRAVDTAEFVLREMSTRLSTDKCNVLRSELEIFRHLVAGVKLTSK